MDIPFRRVELDMYFSKYAHQEDSNFLKSDLMDHFWSP